MTKIKISKNEGGSGSIDTDLLEKLVKIYDKPENSWTTPHITNLAKESRDEILRGYVPATLDSNYLDALGNIRGIKASPIDGKSKIELKPFLPPYALGVEWEIRALENGKVIRRLGDVKTKIERSIASQVDPEELGKLYEDGFTVSMETLQSRFGTPSSQVEKKVKSLAEKRRQLGELLIRNLFMFADVDEPEILEIRSPPFGDMESLERFLTVAKNAIDETSSTTNFSFVPFGILQDNTLFSANVNVHVKIPTPTDLTFLGTPVKPTDYRYMPLKMVNVLRNYYTVLTSHSRNSTLPSSKIWWLEKYLQVREYQRRGKEDFMVGDRFSWNNYRRSVTGQFRPNISIRPEYWTIEANLDGQVSVSELLADAQLIGGTIYNALEFSGRDKVVERDYLEPTLESTVLNEELVGSILEKVPMALMPSLESAKEFSSLISYTLKSDQSAAIYSMLQQGLLSKVPMSKVRSDLAKYSVEFWKSTPEISSAMTNGYPESGSYRQSVELEKSGYQEMMDKASESLSKGKKWRI